MCENTLQLVLTQVFLWLVILQLIYSHYKNPTVVTIMPWVRGSNKLHVLIHYTPIKDVDQFTGW